MSVIDRRLRRAVTVGAGMCLLVGGCATSASDSSSASRESSPPTVSASSAAASRTVDPDHPATGPAAPVLGKAYPYDLYVHCGGEYAAFAGASWRTANPPGDPGATVNPDGTATYTGYLAGWMTLLNQDTAVFAVAGTTKLITYQRTAQDGPVCA
jgi:hypothetical protein